METQLVRLDKPYNLICGKRGDFALHIATLIIVDGYEKDSNNPMTQYPFVTSYPVVNDRFKMVDGAVWSHNPLKDCLTICNEEEGASLYDLHRVMRFLEKHKSPLYQTLTPGMFTTVLRSCDIPFYMPKEADGSVTADYDVELVFEEENDGGTCMVYSNRRSKFYFSHFFLNEPELIQSFPGERTNVEAISDLAKYRDAYLQGLKYEGLRSIRFTTKNAKYQWFVEKLNNSKGDE